MTRRVRGLNIVIAYPGTLGDGLPEPPYGFMFLVDDEGAYILDDFGNYIVVEWNNG